LQNGKKTLCLIQTETVGLCERIVIDLQLAQRSRLALVFAGFAVKLLSVYVDVTNKQGGAMR